MTKYGSDQVGFLLLGGYDILGVSTSLEIDKEAMIEDTTAFGVADQTFEAVGLNRAALSQAGFYDDATGNVNEALVAMASKVLCFGIEGNTIGKKIICMRDVVNTYERKTQIGQLHKASATFSVSSGVDEGHILHAHTQETGDANIASVDQTGAASSAGGECYLQVSELTLGGYTNVTIYIEDSSDDAAFGTLQVFTAVTAHPAAEHITVAAGEVLRYVRARIDFTGAGSSATCSFVVGFKRS